MEVLFWDKVLEKSIVHMNVKSCIKTTRIYTTNERETGFEVNLESGEHIFYHKDGFEFMGCAQDVYFR